jgi:hypothetical protein
MAKEAPTITTADTSIAAAVARPWPLVMKVLPSGVRDIGRSAKLIHSIDQPSTVMKGKMAGAWAARAVRLRIPPPTETVLDIDGAAPSRGMLYFG